MGTTTTKTDELVDLKRNLRCQIHVAAAHGTLTGDDVLGALMCVVGEMVANVDDAARRAEFVETVVTFFPGFVEMARIPEGAKVQ